MDIGPIRNLLAVTPRSAELEPPSVFAVDASARAGDDSGTPSRDKPSSKRRHEQFEEDEFTLSAADSTPEFSTAVNEPGSQRRINIFV